MLGQDALGKVALGQKGTTTLRVHGIFATIVASASLRGVPISNYKQTLSSPRVLYTAVINPWSVSDRNA